MKAAELNGTHLGQNISLQMSGAVLTDILIEVIHAADLISDTPLCSAENTTTLGQRHATLRFQTFGTVHLSPDAVVILQVPTSSGKQHWLTENHNADPVCSCGWGPEHLWPREKPVDRADGRDMVRRHIRSQPTARTNND